MVHLGVGSGFFLGGCCIILGIGGVFVQCGTPQSTYFIPFLNDIKRNCEIGAQQSDQISLSQFHDISVEYCRVCKGGVTSRIPSK